MTKYNVSPLVAREIEFSTGTIFGGSWCRYYDYSPSQVEAIIFGIPQLTPEHQDYVIEGLKTHLRNFIANEENDEDMISQYSDTLESLEKYESDHRETELFSGLYISETINKL